jgi:mono/diheme cytochrome c family protein
MCVRKERTQVPHPFTDEEASKRPDAEWPFVGLVRFGNVGSGREVHLPFRFFWFALGLILIPAGSLASSPMDRGRYLDTLGDCQICHTAPGAGSQPYAGGYPLEARFGTVYSSNITPDKATGIGDWSADQFYRALTEGNAHGRLLYPAFPFAYFTQVSRADSDALFAYLRTIKPVSISPPADKLVFPLNIRAMMVFWDWLFVPQSNFKHDPDKSAEWNRGGDIVHGLGHCGGCHTPKNFLFADQQNRFLQGDFIDGWYAPNLTNSPRTGIGGWTANDLETFLETGSNRFERVVGSMKEVVRVSTSQFTDNDRRAVAVYLKSLSPTPERTPPMPSAAAIGRGKAGFVEVCSSCHEADTKDYPPLAHNAIVQFSNPGTMLRVMLQGSQSVPAPGHSAGYSMPGFAALSDAELADIATYVRNSWGNRGSTVSAKSVGDLRNLLRPMD